MKDFGRFKVWHGDVNYLDYGGTWIWVVQIGEYHFIRLMNWEDAVGEREAAEVGFKYNMELSVVLTPDIPGSTKVDALKSCGMTEAVWDLVTLNKDYFEADKLTAGACFEHGAKARIEDVDTNNFHKTFRELAERSREIAGDDSALHETVANRIGQTAFEYMTGSMGPALARGLEAGSQEARILAKMYQASQGQTLGGHVDRHGDTVMDVVLEAEVVNDPE